MAQDRLELQPWRVDLRSPVSHAHSLGARGRVMSSLVTEPAGMVGMKHSLTTVSRA